METDKLKELDKAYHIAVNCHLSSPDQYQYRQNQLLVKIAEMLLGPYWEHKNAEHQNQIEEYGKKYEKEAKEDPICVDTILEVDFLRMLCFMSQNNNNALEIANKNICVADLKIEACRKIYYSMISKNTCSDWLAIATDTGDRKCIDIMLEILKKKVNPDRIEECFKEDIQRILERNYMEAREAIKLKIQSGHCSDDEVLCLVKQFDNLKKTPPKIKGLD